jgi:putative hydrolase of the HAD superfamily
MNAAVDALIFDLDDTLIVEEACAEAAFVEAGELARIRYGLDPHELHATLRKTCRELWYAFSSHPYCKRIGISSWEGMWAEFTGAGPDLTALREWAPAYRYGSWKAALHSFGIDDSDLAAKMAEAFPRLRRKKNVVHGDAVRALEQFSRSHKLGLLTNGAPDLQRRKINGAGIAKYFSHILISGEVGIGKPDPRLFTMILDRMKTSGATALMIGNSLASDIQGAQDAGMQAVWINRSGPVPQAGITPDWEISTLDELNTILLSK